MRMSPRRIAKKDPTRIHMASAPPRIAIAVCPLLARHPSQTSRIITLARLVAATATTRLESESGAARGRDQVGACRRSNIAAESNVFEGSQREITKPQWTVAASSETLRLVKRPPETTQQSCLAPAERRLGSHATNPASHSAQLASMDVFPCIPITTGKGVPVLIAQEDIGAVSQAAGAAAGWFTAPDALAHEMDPLTVLSRDAQVPKWTERP